MIQQTNDVDKYIGNMLKSFLNNHHRKEVEEYLFVRERIDKVNDFTRRNDVQSLLALDNFLKNKPFEKATQDDLLKWEGFLQKEYVSEGKRIRYEQAKKEGKDAQAPKKGLGPSSIEQYESHVKRFYKYLFNKKEYKKGKRFQKTIPYPDNVSWISTSNANQKELPLDKLLTEEKLMQLLNICEQPRDQAMIAAGFYDAGLRIGELISLNIRNVGFDELGGCFTLPKKGEGLKTGMRKIRLFIMPSSTKYLKDFLNNHPFKQYEDAPLFYSRDGRVFYNVLKKSQGKTVKQSDFEKLRMSRPGIEQIIIRLCKIAGIPTLTPHQLRHNSCTLSCKKGFNEMQMRIRYGWSKTSKMPSRYTHLVNKDLDDKIKEITGFKEPEEPEISKLVTILCRNCQEDNVPTNIHCSRCGFKLNRTKEELATPTATETGIAIQKSMSQDEMYQLMFKKLQDMEKEVKELKKQK